MARRTASRMELRRQAEVADTLQADAEAAKRAPAKRKTSSRRRKSEKALPRKMLMWAVYNGSLKEEGRYTYAELDKAEEKLEALRAKATKKLYFLQPIKVPLADAAAAGLSKEDEVSNDDEDAVPVPKPKDGEEEE